MLAASIEKSRQKWLSGAIFQKYWTKPTKKKGVQDLENPSKESMAKLGNCKLVVEPHTFDITLYAIRETTYSTSAAVTQPSPRYETPWQHESPYSSTNQPPRNGTLPTHTSNSRQESGGPNGVLPPFREGFAQYDPSYPAPVTPKPAPPPPPMPRPQQYNPGTSESATSKQDAQMHADPVIQMLAARASSDPVLKALMKDVAAGIGTPSQLKTFQSHIDELHEIIKRDAANKPSDTVTNTSQLAPASSNSYSSTYTSGHTTSGSINSYAPSHTETPVKSEPNHSSPFAYLRQTPAPIPKYKAPPQPRQETTGIAFDFANGSGDRFLIPKQSILEYLPGYASVVVSFLLIHNGNDDLSSNKASDKSTQESSQYYQPITMQLHGSSKHLEQLAKVVAPQEEVVKYMNNVMDKKRPSKPSFLAFRLPKTNEVTIADGKQANGVPKEEIPKKVYEAPDLLRPLYLSAKI